MISVAPPLAIRRTRAFRSTRLLGVAIVLLTVSLAAYLHPRVSVGGETSAGRQNTLGWKDSLGCQSQLAGNRQLAAETAAPCELVSAPFAVDEPGAPPQWRLPSVRAGVAFGDATWNAMAADQCAAAVAAARRRQLALATRRVAPLWASLQVGKVRLQI